MTYPGSMGESWKLGELTSDRVAHGPRNETRRDSPARRKRDRPTARRRWLKALKRVFTGRT